MEVIKVTVEAAAPLGAERFVESAARVSQTRDLNSVSSPGPRCRRPFALARLAYTRSLTAVHQGSREMRPIRPGLGFAPASTGTLPGGSQAPSVSNGSTRVGLGVSASTDRKLSLGPTKILRWVGMGKKTAASGGKKLRLVLKGARGGLPMMRNVRFSSVKKVRLVSKWINGEEHIAPDDPETPIKPGESHHGPVPSKMCNASYRYRNRGKGGLPCSIWPGTA